VVRLVSIEGNEQTHDNVIRREISSLPGYTFRRSEVMRSQRDIYNLGFFDDVNLDTTERIRPAPSTSSTRSRRSPSSARSARASPTRRPTA